LVHEAYVRLVGTKDTQWQNHAHSFASAAIAMRRILIERARRKAVGKRVLGERAETAPLETGIDPESLNLLALDLALKKLSNVDKRLTDVVHLRFFAGLTVEQTAETMGVSPRTVKRDWDFARVWLHNEMKDKDAADHSGEE